MSVSVGEKQNTIAALRERCRDAGILLTVRDGKLIAQGPDTPEVEALLAEASANKAALLEAMDDPRTDLPDTAAWQTLMRLTATTYGREAGTPYEGLHYVRCQGARLVKVGVGMAKRGIAERWKIVAETDYAGDWEADRAVALVPHKTAVTELLERLKKENL